MKTIAEIVSRRTDLGTFLVHLTRDTEESNAREKLFSILDDFCVYPRSPFGSAVSRLKQAIEDGVATGADLEYQNCVCFTETPLQHLHLLIGEVRGRRCQFSPYGVALPKKLSRTKGVNPIWYVDITPGREWLINPVNALVEEAVQSGSFRDHPIARIAPFIEQMGNQPGVYWKEFWWEREWRARETVSLDPSVIIIAPEREHDEIRERFKTYIYRPNLVDAEWGLEDVIARLAGFSSDQVGVFEQ